MSVQSHSELDDILWYPDAILEVISLSLSS